MFDLNEAIREWKNDLGSMSPGDLEELEDHLRADVAERAEDGADEAEAFAAARRALGSPQELTHEYRKVKSPSGLKWIGGGLLLYALSFFLPVYEVGLWNPDRFMGWEAFFMGFDPEAGVLGVSSGLTNFLMVATVVALARRRISHWLPKALSVAVPLNSVWLVYADPRSDLMIGYYAWWASFAIVAAGLWLETRRKPALSVRTA